MGNKYLATALAPPTQLEAAPGTVENSAGGQSYQIDPWDRLTRFLILGTEGGTYYARERELTVENVQALRSLVAEDGERFVREVAEISDSGRAPKNDPAILALALAAAADDAETRKLALKALPDVCRTATHLFTFLEFSQKLRGWGRGLRKAVASWYTEKDPDRLGYQLVKYRQRGGWTHRDALRLAHPQTADDEKNDLLRYAVGKPVSEHAKAPDVVGYFEAAQRSDSALETARLVHAADGKLSREMLKTEHLTEPAVWTALLETGSLPMTALIRNLGNMSKNGALKPGTANVGLVVRQLQDADRIRKARVHPVAVLAALRTYAQGRGYRGAGEWEPVPQVVDALNDAFYLAFGNVEPTGKRIMLALDVSGSMSYGDIQGIPGLTPRDATAALALVTAAVEENYSVFGFSTSFTPLRISAGQRLDDAIRAVSGLPFSGTDCALPMLYAEQEQISYDAFVVYTDNETWAGRVHPDQALRQYRRASGIDAKLVVVGMTATDFTIANPNDSGMLDVVGFDTATPQLISEFIR